MSGISDWFSGMGSGGKGPVKLSMKRMLWLGAAVILGISLIVLGGGGQQSPSGVIEKKDTGEAAAVGSPPKSIMVAEEDALSARLQSMLERIEGSGEVKVTVRLATSSRESYATNTTVGSKNTLEKDQGGGTRTINENSDTTQLVIAKNGKGDTPVVQMETASRVAGVLVVAGGASSPLVKERLFEAVRVALNVEPHKILVLPGEGGVKR